MFKLTSLLPADDAARIAALRWTARVAVEGLSAGRHRSPHLGASVEFKEHRAYSPGDDLRSIDWKAYGKSDRLFVRQYEDETNLRATVLVDQSASMGYAGTRAAGLISPGAKPSGETKAPAKPASKYDYAAAMAVALSHLMIASQDAAGVIRFSDRVLQKVPVGSRPSHLRVVAAAVAAGKPEGEIDWNRVCRAVAGELPRRGVVIVLTDGLAPPEILGRNMRLLRGRGHEVVLVQILDPDEIDFPFTGRAEFRDLEQPGLRPVVDGRSVAVAYRRAIEQHNAAVSRACQSAAVRCVLVRTDQPLARALAKVVDRRAKMSA